MRGSQGYDVGADAALTPTLSRRERGWYGVRICVGVSPRILRLERLWNGVFESVELRKLARLSYLILWREHCPHPNPLPEGEGAIRSEVEL